MWSQNTTAEQATSVDDRTPGNRSFVRIKRVFVRLVEPLLARSRLLAVVHSPVQGLVAVGVFIFRRYFHAEV